MKAVESQQAQQIRVPIHPSKVEYSLSVYVKGLQNASSTRDKHMYTTRFEVGAFVDSENSINKMLTDGQNFNTRVLHKLYTYCVIQWKFKKS